MSPDATLPVRPPERLRPVGRPRWLERALLVLLLILLGYQTQACLRLQKTPGWDAAIGFLTLQSSLEHGDFNRLHHPALDNLAEDRVDFIAWWTPGQYLVPHWMARALHVDLGTALRLLTVACSVGGLVGYGLLFTKVGFSRATVYLSLIVVGSQEYFLKASRIYLGGELLLFGIAPFVILSVLAVRTSLVRRALLAAGVGFIAVFFKASALTLFLALAAYLGLEILGWPGRALWARREWREPLRRLLVLAAVGALYVVAIELAYFARGPLVAADPRMLAALAADRWWGVAAALAGPIYGAFSLLEPFSRPPFFIPVALLSLLAVAKIGRRGSSGDLPDYRRLLVAHYVAFAVFFSYAYLKGVGVSYEPRHFRPLGLVLLPGLVDWLLGFRPRTVVAGAIAALSLALVVSYHAHAAPVAPDSTSRWGIRQPVSNASLEGLHRVDAAWVTPDTIVFNGFGACPTLLLEFSHGRRLQDDSVAYFGFTRPDRTAVPWYHGTADSIVLVVSKNNPWYFGASLEEIARTFEHPLHVVPCFENDELVVYRGSAR